MLCCSLVEHVFLVGEAPVLLFSAYRLSKFKSSLAVQVRRQKPRRVQTKFTLRPSGARNRLLLTLRSVTPNLNEELFQLFKTIQISEQISTRIIPVTQSDQPNKP